MEDRFDVVVVGAGPAGAVAAIAARRADPSLRVLVLDRADFPRDKACGDGIAPQAVDVLAALGAQRVIEGYRPVRRLRVSAPSGTSACGDLRRPDWVIPRLVFDARLVAEARRAGATVRRHRVRAVAVAERRIVVDGEIAASVVVAADGANSIVRRALGLPSNRPEHCGVAIRAYAPATHADQRIVMDAANWPAYAWSFPVGDGTANVGYGALRSRFHGSRADLLDGLERTLGEQRDVRDVSDPRDLRDQQDLRAQQDLRDLRDLRGQQDLHDLRGPPVDGIDTATVRGHTLPLSTQRPPLAVGRVLLAGDAASLVNPLSGEGIYYALVSGALAGRAATAPETAARTYRRGVARLLGRHFRHTGLLARALTGPALAEAAVAAAGRAEDAFADLCELTLGRGTVTPRLAAQVARALAVQPPRRRRQPTAPAS